MTKPTPPQTITFTNVYGETLTGTVERTRFDHGETKYLVRVYRNRNISSRYDKRTKRYYNLYEAVTVLEIK